MLGHDKAEVEKSYLLQVRGKDGTVTEEKVKLVKKLPYGVGSHDATHMMVEIEMSDGSRPRVKVCELEELDG